MARNGAARTPTPGALLLEKESLALARGPAADGDGGRDDDERRRAAEAELRRTQCDNGFDPGHTLLTISAADGSVVSTKPLVTTGGLQLLEGTLLAGPDESTGERGLFYTIVPTTRTSYTS